MLVGTGEPRVVMRCPRPTPVSLQVVSPTISSPVCQEQLIEAGKLVDRSVENCVRACQAATDDTELLKQVSAAASVVSQAQAGGQASPGSVGEREPMRASVRL